MLVTEPLAIKVALEEWWHWLKKGLRCHFWCGQIRRTFSTLRWLKDSVKDENVFFNLFNLISSFRLGSKNGKQGSLSSISQIPRFFLLIIPELCILGALTWKHRVHGEPRFLKGTVKGCSLPAPHHKWTKTHTLTHESYYRLWDSLHTHYTRTVQ